MLMSLVWTIGRARRWAVVFQLLLLGPRLGPVSASASQEPKRQLDPSYRPPPVWGCEAGLPVGAFHVVVATLAPEPTALVPWIWNLGLTGAEIWIYHRQDSADPRLASAAAQLTAFEPYPCESTVHLQQLLPNKGREAAVFLTHIVRHYDRLPEGLVLIHDHGPAARHSLCGPFFRRLRGYYIGIREQHPELRAAAANTTLPATSADTATTITAAAGRRSLSASRRNSRNSRVNSASAKRNMFMRFADQLVSLSSGCQENWLKGCCAVLVCAEDGEPVLPSGDGLDSDGAAARDDGSFQGAQRLLLGAEAAATGLSGAGGAGRQQGSKTLSARCPFKTSRCLANASALAVPLHVGPTKGTQRWVYLHGAGGLYDTRYENLVVLHGETPEAAAAAATGGLTNGGFGPLSLVRYASQDAFETTRSQTSSSRSLDYPTGGAQRSQQETYGELSKILASYDFSGRKAPGNFKSCCASLMLRPKHIRHWPLEMYEQILSYTLDTKNTYHASLAVSHHGWSMWAGADVTGEDLLRYFDVDLALLRLRGCPSWRMVAATTAEGGAGAG